MSISYIPEQKPYKNLTPFKRLVMQSFPWINEDFDAMTNNELLAKVIEYLNEVIANSETEQENIESLYNAFVSLQNYVNNYFDNLDVQNEINAKLDSMAQNGTLREIMEPYFQSIENQYNQANLLYTNLYSNISDDLSDLQNQVDSIIANSQSTEGNSELINIRTAYDGTLYPTAGASVRTQMSNLNNENENTISKSALNVETTNFGLFNYTPTQFAGADITKRWGLNHIITKNSGIRSISIAQRMTEDTTILLEFWKINDTTGAITRTSSKTVTIPKKENSNVNHEWKRIPIEFFADDGNYYMTFTVSTLRWLDYSTDSNISNDYRAMNLPNTNDTTFTTSQIGITGSAKLLAGMVIEKVGYDLLSKNFTIVDINGNGDYTSPIDAVNNAVDGETILIMPGVYIIPNGQMVNMSPKEINLIGVNKYECIIKSYDGRYDYAPIWASCGSIKNLTVSNEYSSTGSALQDESDRGGYAIHIEREYGKDHQMLVDNCICISDFSSAIGCGLRKNNTTEISNCELTFVKHEGIGNSNYGALFVHDSAGEQGNSTIKLKNNIITSTAGQCFRLSQSIGGANNVKCIFENNTLYDTNNIYNGTVTLVNDPFNTSTGVFHKVPSCRLNNNDLINY